MSIEDLVARLLAAARVAFTQARELHPDESFHIVWGVFLLVAARNPLAHRSFLSFTMWANLAHALLMVAQAATDLDRYWSKFLTDIPFILILALGIFFLRPSERVPAEG
ncbi:DUF6632 domain-containing protein [Nonomuraea sp. NPDC049784]|uniref:DUF6632 domain-containing protein n=1 Tax=Nonomuraea sp. NPDC049784 TaxID=3154361 RepID=UPI0033E71FA9